MTKIVPLALGLLLLASASAGAADDKMKTMLVQGKVTAASNDSLTIEHSGKPMTFAVDASTKLLGKGLSTMTREKKAKGEGLTLTDGVGTGDLVKVSYHDMDGKLHAAQVTVVQKALAAK
jgi:hypothetical protein